MLLVAVADDDVIVDADVQQLARLHELAREPQVFTARCWKTGGRQRGTPKTGGRRKGTPNRLTALKRILGPILDRDARESRLFDAIGTPAYEGRLKELEQERRREWEWDA